MIDSRGLDGETLTIHWAKDGRTAAGACVRFDKLEDLVTEGRMISNVDQFAIKDWHTRRVSDRWHQVERGGKRGKRAHLLQGSGE